MPNLRPLKYQDIKPQMELATQDTKDTVRAGVNGDDEFPEKLLNFRFRGTRGYNMACIIVAVYAYCLRSKNPVLEKFASTIMRLYGDARKLLEAVRQGDKEKIKKYVNSMQFRAILEYLLWMAFPDENKKKTEEISEEDKKKIKEIEKRINECIKNFVNQACKITKWRINGDDVSALIDALYGVRQTQFISKRAKDVVGRAATEKAGALHTKSQVKIEIETWKKEVAEKQKRVKLSIQELDRLKPSLAKKTEEDWHCIFKIEKLLGLSSQKLSEQVEDVEKKYSQYSEEYVGQIINDLESVKSCHGIVEKSKELAQELCADWYKRIDDSKARMNDILRMFVKVLENAIGFGNRIDAEWEGKRYPNITDMYNQEFQKLKEEFETANGELEKAERELDLDRDLDELAGAIKKKSQEAQRARESVKQILQEIGFENWHYDRKIPDLNPSEDYLLEQAKIAKNTILSGSDDDFDKIFGDRQPAKPEPGPKKEPAPDPEPEDAPEAAPAPEPAFVPALEAVFAPEPKPEPVFDYDTEHIPQVLEELKENYGSARTSNLYRWLQKVCKSLKLSKKNYKPWTKTIEVKTGFLKKERRKVTVGLPEALKDLLLKKYSEDKGEITALFKNVIEPSFDNDLDTPYFSYKKNGTPTIIKMPEQISFYRLVGAKLSRIPRIIKLEIANLEGIKQLKNVESIRNVIRDLLHVWGGLIIDDQKFNDDNIAQNWVSIAIGFARTFRLLKGSSFEVDFEHPGFGLKQVIEIATREAKKEWKNCVDYFKKELDEAYENGSTIQKIDKLEEKLRRAEELLEKSGWDIIEDQTCEILNDSRSSIPSWIVASQVYGVEIKL